jgi:CHAT domain-containing protein/tetratricopeptide (TPR) repeat protein
MFFKVVTLAMLFVLPQAASATTPSDDCSTSSASPGSGALAYARQMFRRVINAGVQPFHPIDYDAELRVFAAGLACRLRVKDWSGAAGMYESIGVIEADLGRYADALDAETQAAALNRKIGNADGQAYNALDIGDVQKDLGMYADSLASYNSAATLYRQAADPAGVAMALNDVAIVQELQGKYADALASVRQSDSVRGHPDAKSLLAGGIIQGRLGRYDDALRSLDEAFQVEQHARNLLGQANVLAGFAVVEELSGSFASAADAAQKSAQLDAQLGIPQWQGLATAGSAYAKLDRIDDALHAYDAALDDIERLRAGVSANANVRSAFFATTLDVYDTYIQYLLELDRRFPGKGYDRKAFDVFERRQARALLEEIGKSTARRFAGIPASVIAEQGQMTSAISSVQRTLAGAMSSPRATPAMIQSLQARLKELRAQQTSIDNAVKAHYPKYYQLLHPQPLDVNALQSRVLRSDEAVLAYALWDTQGALFVVSRDRFAVVPLPGSITLAASVARVRAHVDGILRTIESGFAPDALISNAAAKDVGSFAADSAALYAQLVPVSVRSVVEKKSLIVVPSGVLYDVPWEALVTSVEGTQPHYLIEDHAISYAPSASLLALVRAGGNHKVGSHKLLAFARPAFGAAPSAGVAANRGVTAEAMQYNAARDATGGTFPDLPGTAVEANAVRDALHAGADSVVTGESASKAHLFALNSSHELATYRYILFATHAVLPHEVKTVDQPALVLAHPFQNGFLTMGDVFDLSLNADFVALSACNTGEGARSSGDGISGMTRAFMYAGTPAISVTLWQVDDTAAPRLTPVFFADLAAGMPPAQALRAAKLKMLKSTDPRFRHPYAWAPTVIFGDADAPPN